MLSIVGLLIGIGLFVYAVYKRVNILLASLAACAIMSLFSRNPVYSALTGSYMTGAAQFLNKYFLMIMFSAVLGRLMSDGGGAKKISLVFENLLKGGSAQRKKYFSVLFVAVLYFYFLTWEFPVMFWFLRLCPLPDIFLNRPIRHGGFTALEVHRLQGQICY